MRVANASALPGSRSPWWRTDEIAVAAAMPMIKSSRGVRRSTGTA